MALAIKLRNKNECRPPRVLGGFLLPLVLLILLLMLPTIAYGQDKNISLKSDRDRASEEFSKFNIIDKDSEKELDSLELEKHKRLDLPELKVKERDIKAQDLQKSSRERLKDEDEQPLPKVDEKGRINLKSLPRPSAQAMRSSILSVKPQSAAAAQVLGWPSKPLSHPEPIESLLKATPNELESLTRPERSDGINQIKVIGAQGEVESRLLVTPEYLTFFAKVGENPQSQTIKIRNKGTDTLNYSLSESIAWLSLDSSGGSVTDGEDIITISINTAGLAEPGSPYTEEIVVSNDNDGTDREYVRVKLYITNAEGLVTTYSYDPNGNLTRRIDADGNVIEYEYDNANRLTKILYPNGDTVTYEYDKNGNKTKVTDKTGITEYIYDQFNRLYAAIFQEVAAIVYHYDNNGNLKKLINPDGREINYVYDGDNRLTQVSYKIDSTTYTTTYGYDPQTGNLISKTLPNGVVTTYQYDTADRLTDCINRKSGGELISSYHYTLDANGNRESVVETTPEGSKTTTYQYDELNRLTRTIYPDATDVSYTYDDAGNRLTKTTDGDTLNYQYDEDNRLIEAGDEIFLYDKRGNLTKRISPGKTIAYTYDYENRLIRYEDGVRVVEYEYNGDGIRLSKTVDGEKTIFINDIRTPLTQVVMECTGNWYIKKRYVYGRDLISQEE